MFYFFTVPTWNKVFLLLLLLLLVNNRREYRYQPPGIHGLACKKTMLHPKSSGWLRYRQFLIRMT